MKFLRPFFLTVLLLISISVIIVIGLVIYLNTQKRDERNLNLILISVDTLRPDHMGIYGYNKNTTPNIDKWAKNATVFTNVHTFIPATYPSFVELMTGESPFESKIYNNGVVGDEVYPGGKPLPNDIPLLSELLKRNNYTTAAFITNPVLSSAYTNLNRGFDSYSLQSLWDTHDTRDKYYNFIISSLDWIDKNKKNKFFLWVHLLDPHAPYTPSKDLECKFNNKFCNSIEEIGLTNLEQQRKNLEGWHGIRHTLPDNTVQLFETLYDGSIAYSDRLVGKILDKIKSAGIEDKTLVVFYGDHGEGFDHNYYFTHSDKLYNSSTNIPLLIKTPFNKNVGKKVNEPLQNTQIMPTILQLLNIHTDNSHLTDNSFYSLLNGGFHPFSYRNVKYTYSVNVDLTSYSISDNRFKFIYSINKKNGNITKELYDLVNDPKELNNVLYKIPEIGTELKINLLSYLAQYKLPKPINKPPEQEKANSGNAGNVIEQLKSVGY